MLGYDDLRGHKLRAEAIEEIEASQTVLEVEYGEIVLFLDSMGIVSGV